MTWQPKHSALSTVRHSQMGQRRCITWCGQVNKPQPSDQAAGEHDATSRAYRCRSSSVIPSPLDGDKLRRQESYPSNGAPPSTAWLPRSASSFSSSVYSSSTQDEQDMNDTGPPRQRVYAGPQVLPATSRDFAELFPSSRKLLIRHDDMTFDGNMNLRVDVPIATPQGDRRDITLYHLRMYDLKCRDFSLRRYCRDSGREVCHCVRKSHKSMFSAGPNVRRSLSSAFAAMLPKHDSKSSNVVHQPAKLRRQDSGYDTSHSDKEEEQEESERPHSSHSNSAHMKDASDHVSLEFSNYAHLDLRRRGFKADKRYDFDYWGTSYSWHRSTQRLGTAREVSYHLTRRDGSLVARIVPEQLSEDETLAEMDKGGWIHPCSMRIVDKDITNGNLADVGDVILSTGLIALVDDSVRRHFHKRDERRHRFHMPVVKGRLHRKAEDAPVEHANTSGDAPTFAHRQLLARSL